MKQEPSEWFELTLEIYDDYKKGEWVAAVSWGRHPDEIVTQSWSHPKLQVVTGMAIAFMHGRVAQFCGTGYRRVMLSDNAAKQLGLFD
jgi:hypothetical protein